VGGGSRKKHSQNRRAEVSDMKEKTLLLSDLKDAVVLVGSGLSGDETNNLPTGQTVSRDIVAKIVRPVFDHARSVLGVTNAEVNRIEQIMQATPLEVLLQDYPEPQVARRILANTYQNAQPNPLHFALASALAAGNIRHIITTNYDLCIETAIAKAGLVSVIHSQHQVKDLSHQQVSDSIHKEVNDSEKDVPESSSILFKIHGCASEISTMVFQLSQEGAMKQWKRDLLKKIIDGRDVVVIGYSGLDFDLCPVLLGLRNYKALYWLFQEKRNFSTAIGKASPVVQIIHQEQTIFSNVFGILGGFDAFFGDFVEPKDFVFRPSSTVSDVGSQLFSQEPQDRDRFNLYRGAVFHEVSCRTGIEAAYLAVGEALRGSPEALRLWSNALERAGRYLDSASILERLVDTLPEKRDQNRLLEALFWASGRYYTGRFFLRFLLSKRRFQHQARKMMNGTNSLDPDQVHAMSTYLSLLEVKALMRIPIIGKLLAMIPRKRLLTGNLNSAAQTYYAAGKWQDFRLLIAAANDAGVSLTVSNPFGSPEEEDFFLDEVDAFAHANNIVGHASAYRRVIRKERDRCEDILEILAIFGHSAEFWKSFQSFYATISKRRRRLYKGFATAELLNCQYPMLLKVVWLIRLWIWILAVDLGICRGR